MPKTGGSFRGLVTYLTSSRGNSERLGLVCGTNCVSADVPSAVLEVESVQARNHRARHGTYHLVLSFPAGEEPPAQVLAAIERRACDVLGFTEHQRISVVHHDTDHLHVHIAINRIHPETHRAHWPSYSKLALDGLCVDVEQEYGLRPTPHRTRQRAAQVGAANALRASIVGLCVDQRVQAGTWAELHARAEEQGLRVQLQGNGLVFVGRDDSSVRASSVVRDLSKAHLERRLGAFEPSSRVQPPIDREQRKATRRAPDSERMAGVETFIGWIQRECAENLRAARTWRELHEAAARHGLLVRPHGNGLVFLAPDGLATKASSVARDLSKAALERRFGAFEPGAALLLEGSRYERRPVLRSERSPRLYERYRHEREAAIQARDRAVAQARQQRDREEARLQRHSQRRWAAVGLVAKGRVAWALWSAYAKHEDQRDRERARARYRTAMRAAAAQHPTPGWLEWLRNRPAERREVLNPNLEDADEQGQTRRPAHSPGSPRAARRSSARPVLASRLRESHGGGPRPGSTPQALAALQDLSALPLVRFGRAPQVLLPSHARADVEQRGAEQPDRRLRRDPAEPGVSDGPSRPSALRRRLGP